MKKGLLIILSGPSGVGKGSVRKYIETKKAFDMAFSVSMTTREPRQNEVNGQDYYFVSKEEFQKRIDQGKFLEWCEFVGNRYGTPKDKVDELRNKGINVLLEIEINGAKQVMDNVKDDGLISFFIVPPSLEELERRIRTRKSETEEVIQKRLEKGKKEMAYQSQYQYVICNDSLSNAGNAIIDIVKEKIKNS